MSAVLSGVLAKVKYLLPDQIGANKRWTEQTVNAYIVAADRAVRERCAILQHEQEITLQSADHGYNLDTAFVNIDFVEFSEDGTNYDWRLKPARMSDFDEIAPNWRDISGSRPDLYCIISTPGTQPLASEDPAPAQIIIYPYVSTVSGEKIKVSGSGVIESEAAMASALVADDVQKKCHVPYVLALLYSVADPDKSAAKWREFLAGVEAVHDRFISEYMDRPSRGTRNNTRSNRRWR